MEQLNNLLSSLGGINPFFPFIAVSFLITIGLLLSLIPLSVFCAVLERMFSDQVVKLFNAVDKYTIILNQKSHHFVKRARRLAKVYMMQTVPTSASSIKHVIKGGAEDLKELNNYLSSSISQVQDHFDMIQSGLNKKTMDEKNQEVENQSKQKKLEEIQFSLNNLSELTDKYEKIILPEVDNELLVLSNSKWREGLANIIIFGPLLIAVMILNTYLLNQFFETWVDDTNIFGFGFPIKVTLSLIISFMFTAIEAGIGVYFASQETNTNKSDKSIESITNFFGWFVLAMLCIVEAYFYFMLSLEFRGYSQDQFALLTVFEKIDASWMTLMGPSIVGGLFLFGHKSTIAFFNLFKSTDLSSLKTDLDDTDSQVNFIANKVDELNEKIKILNKEEFDLNNGNQNNKANSDKSSITTSDKKILSSMQELSKQIIEKTEKLNDRNNETIREIDVLPSKDQKSFWILDVVLAIFIFLGLFGFSQILSTIFLTSGIDLNLDYYYSFFIMLAVGLGVLGCGHLFFQNQDLVINEGEFALRSSPSMFMLKSIALLGVVGIVTGIFLVEYSNNVSTQIIALSLFFPISLFILGFNLKMSLFSIFFLSNQVFHYSVALIFQIFIAFINIIRIIISFLFGIITGLAIPWRRFFRGV